MKFRLECDNDEWSPFLCVFVNFNLYFNLKYKYENFTYDSLSKCGENRK
jgi:hypothetical protein